MDHCGGLDQDGKRRRAAPCSRQARKTRACRIRPPWLQWQKAIRLTALSTHHKEEASMNFDKDLDARGLNCPLPILRAKKALTDMQSGQVLRVVSTDLGSVKDFQAFCKQTGNELLSHAEASNEYTFFMRRK
jgi:tRNA 2-thiouridine synthesizing protein A